MSVPKLFGAYTAQFPFLDIQEAKIRPVIIIGMPQGQHKVLAVVPISATSVLEDVDISLRHWSDEGLLTVARVRRLTTMLQSDLIAELGELTQDDRQNLQAALRRLLKL